MSLIGKLLCHKRISECEKVPTKIILFSIIIEPNKIRNSELSKALTFVRKN